MLEGVKIKKLKVIRDRRGFLMEILRRDDEIFKRFGQVYITSVKKGIAKAWHYHKKQDDFFTCLHGKALVVLYDQRKKSKTFGKIQKIILTEPSLKGRHLLIKIPKQIVHGFTALTKEARILNIPTKLYNYKKPDEYRYPWDSEQIPYRWPKFVKKGG